MYLRTGPGMLHRPADEPVTRGREGRRYGPWPDSRGRTTHRAGTVWRGLLAALCMGLVPLALPAAETAPPAAGGDRMGAVLEELKAIRQLLEKIERQGMARGPQRPAQPTTATVAVRDKPVMGSASAPVTVVEFTDYQCPYCLRFTRTTFPVLRKDFIDTGKVRWVALNLPLKFHKDARKAAQAAHCAGEQGRFWEMRLALFEHPQELAAEHLPGHAARVGLDVDAFNDCLASDRHLAAIDQDAEDANAVRLTGTPSFIIGRTDGDSVTGQVIIGAQPIRAFNTAIEKALADADRAIPPAAAGRTPPGGGG